MDNGERLDVLCHDRLVGRLFSLDGAIYFSYAEDWIEHGFSISPRSLPLKRDTFHSPGFYFEGLFGVFADSLPDGWGTRLAVKALAKQGVSYAELSPLSKLRYVGADGLGGLSYRPSVGATFPREGDYESLALAAMEFCEEETSKDLDALFAQGGSSGGARPKAHLALDGAEWIVKFRERNDPLWLGKMEYEYNLAAKECGIDVPEARLLPSSVCEGYFASRRFDRENGKRVHVLSLGGLLETPRHIPALDYLTYLQATGYVTQSFDQVLEAYRRAVFNVLAENKDDHAKNFAYRYDEGKKAYVLAPAYDLSFTPFLAEHEMTCCGEGKPGIGELLHLAERMSISSKEASAIIEKTKRVVQERLSPWMRR